MAGHEHAQFGFGVVDQVSADVYRHAVNGAGELERAGVFRVVALPAPTEREKSQMYIQRYLPHFPAAGEVVVFDRSRYNRAGVEPVMGFCTPEETKRSLQAARPPGRHPAQAAAGPWLRGAGPAVAVHPDTVLDSPARPSDNRLLPLPKATEEHLSASRRGRPAAAPTPGVPRAGNPASSSQRVERSCVDHHGPGAEPHGDERMDYRNRSEDRKRLGQMDHGIHHAATPATATPKAVSIRATASGPTGRRLVHAPTPARAM